MFKIINIIIDTPFIIHIIHGNARIGSYLKQPNIIFYLNNYQKKLTKFNFINKSYYFPNFLIEYNISKKYCNDIQNIGIIGRFSKEKNFETIIKSMKYIKKMKLYSW